jgi:hypothetical protein
MNLNFFKNINNAKINPATEDTLAQVQSNTADINTKTATLASTTGTIATNTTNLITNTANILPTKQASMANSMPIAIASDQTVPVLEK